MCDSLHPEHGVRCLSEVQNHLSHYARGPEGPVYWDNPNATVVPLPAKRTARDHGQAREAQRAIRAERRTQQALEAQRAPTRLILGPRARTDDPPSAHLGAALIAAGANDLVSRVATALFDAYPEWVNGRDLQTQETGKDQGLKRLREAKAAGILDYESRPHPSGGTFDYRWKPMEQGLPADVGQVLRHFE